MPPKASAKKKKARKEIGFGVLDVHSHRVETKEEVVDGLRRALGAERRPVADLSRLGARESFAQRTR